MEERATMKALLVLMTFYLCGLCSVAADQKASSISTARSAIEANLNTPGGKAYDQQLGKELVEHHAERMRQCKQTAGGDQDGFWMLLKLEKDGSVNEVLLRPETKIGQCDREVLNKAKFSAPPHDDYWVGVFVRIAH
jgi:hypothetical protein